MKKSLFDLDLQYFADEVSEETEEVADLPSEEDESEETEETEVETEETEETEDFKNEENARYASIRRKAEADAAYRAKAEADARIARICQGVVHPVTGKPITTMDEYEDALYEQERMQSERAMREKGLDPSIIQNVINQNPAIKRAESVLAQAQQQANMTLAQRQLEADLAEISKIDNSIKTFKELENLESFGEILAKVQSGYSLIDAYKMVEFDALMNKGKAGARQAAINQVRGKAHLQGADTLTEDSEDIEVPTADYKMLKEVYPDKTAKQIKKLYNETFKKLHLGGK